MLAKTIHVRTGSQQHVAVHSYTAEQAQEVSNAVPGK